jgi:hypothetical protein
MRTIDFGNKPFDTKIQMTKGGDFFDIYIPPLGHNPVILLTTIYVATFCGVAMWIWNANEAIGSKNIFFILLLPHLLGIGFLVWRCLLILYGKTYLRIDRHEISLTKTLFGQKISRHSPAPKREITKIIFTHAHTVYSGASQRQIPAELKFQIGIRSISIGGNKGDVKHEVEIEWLASEVSQWLDKPLTVVEHPSR